MAGKGKRQAGYRVIERHESHEDVENAGKYFAYLTKTRQEGKQKRRGNDDMQGAQRHIPVGGEVHHHGREEEIDQVDRRE